MISSLRFWGGFVEPCRHSKHSLNHYSHTCSDGSAILLQLLSVLLLLPVLLSAKTLIVPHTHVTTRTLQRHSRFLCSDEKARREKAYEKSSSENALETRNRASWASSPRYRATKGMRRRELGGRERKRETGRDTNTPPEESKTDKRDNSTGGILQQPQSLQS